MRRRRFRKWAKWACTVAAVLAVGLAVLSGLCVWSIEHMSSDRTEYWGVEGSEGLVSFTRAEEQAPRMTRSGWYRSFAWRPGWRWGTARDTRRAVWGAGVQFFRSNGFPTSIFAVGTNVLYPVLLTLIPAALLWRADRRRFKPGACGGCGYDRRGLAVGVKCPECGALPTS